MVTEITPNTEQIDHPLNPICEQWLEKIRLAKQVKYERFGKYAAEAMKFFDGAHDWMWNEEYSAGKAGFLSKDQNCALPTFRMTVNRVFEAVALFGPALYNRNPDITVTAVHPPFIQPEMLGIFPQDEQSMMQYQQIIQQQQMDRAQRDTYAGLKQHYLNWLQVEGEKKEHARRSITEAIVKGMGILWVEMYTPPGSKVSYPRAQHVSVDDIVVDPDAEYWEDVQWIARRCLHAVNRVEREYGLPPKSLKAHYQSLEAQGDTFGSRKERKEKQRTGRTHDLIEYWKVYSKNGFGDRLRKTKNTAASKYNYEAFGDYCYLVVARNVPFPFNLHSSYLQGDFDEAFERVQWETPFWTDGGWPMCRLSFYEKPKDVWPISLIKPCIGEMRFVNWCMSFLADRVAASSQTYVAQRKDASIEIQSQLKSGMAPFTVLEISNMTGRSIDDVISFLTAPEMGGEIWKMVSEVMTMIDKRTGLTDLIYGMTSQQLRSASEAAIKEEQTNIRPDDMAQRVEDWLSDVAMKECEAIVWNGELEDVQPVLGELGGNIFFQQIQTMDFDRIVRDYDYRVASGTARKPNKQSKNRALAELGQVIMPTLQQFAAMGMAEPWNAYIASVAETLDLDVSGFLLQLPSPEEQAEQGPDPEQIKAELEMKKIELESVMKERELEHKEEAHDQEMRHDEEKHDQDMAQAKQMNKLQAAAKRVTSSVR